MFNLFNNAINAVKTLISGKANSAPKPVSSKQHVIQVTKPKPVTELPKFKAPPAANFYIANYGDSSATIRAGQARNDAIAASTAKWYQEQQAETRRAEAERKAREAADAAQKKINDIAGEYRKKALDSTATYRKNQDGNFWSWVTGGFVGDNETRKFAEDQAANLDKNAEEYDKKLTTFTDEQAKRRAEIESMKIDSQADLDEYNRKVKIFSDWETENIDDLNYMYAANTGLYSGYSREASKPGRSPLAQAGQLFGAFGNTWAGQAIGNLFKYTLGSGDENTPSLVTAPSRGVNWLFNSTFNAGGQKNLEGGKVVEGFEPGKNAWTQTYNQRNFNMEYAEKRTEEGFEDWYKTRDLSQWKSDIDSGKIKESEVKDLFKRMYFNEEKNNQGFLDGLEFFADPLLGAGKLGKAGKALGGAAAATKAGSKAGKFFTAAADKVKNSKPFKWLGSEYKNRDQKYSDAVKAADETADVTRSRYLAQLTQKEKALAKARGEEFDDTVLREFKRMADEGDDQAAKWLQQMKDGDFSSFVKIKNFTRAGGVGSNPRLTKLYDLADRWGDLAEKMKLPDEISDSATRFGKGKKKSFYSPRTVYLDDLDTYDFRKQKKNLAPQSAAELRRGVTDRYIVSNVKSDWRGAKTKQMTQLEREISEIKTNYRRDIAPIYLEARKLDAKRGNLSRYMIDRKNRKNIQTGKYEARTGLGRSIWNSTKDAASLPMSVWKKSVLKYRPAWTVNNVAYNVPASVLSGGVGALYESARLLRPKNFKAAMKEVPDNVKADLTGEFGRMYTGKNFLKKADAKLTRGYSNIENWSRLAAFRASKAKGLTDEQSLKRVNKYLYDYKTRNWEVPLKQVVPFWGWSKNLTRAAVQMPFDRPLGAKAFHEVDEYQQGQFDKDFEQVVPELTELGYSEQEIQAIKEEQSKYFKGRLKVGDSYISTPFNAFSDRGLSGIGINPYLSALIESSKSVDSFGNTVSGHDSTYARRLLSKFPQAELAKKGFDSWAVNSGTKKPERKYIGERGSEGYGLTKEKQGYDPSKSNYVRSMDPRAKLGQDALAFLGVPRSLDFDRAELVENKKLQKLTESYFSLNTKGMSFDDAEKARQEVFDKYGVTADEFYTGVLSKYDSDNTKRIKDMKSSAAAKNKLLFDEYGKQPEGTRNLWAVNKIRQLSKEGYFDDNPFLKSFDWLNPDAARRADKQEFVTDALKTGDWSKYRAKYGLTEKQKDYESAQKTGDWSTWDAKYGRSQKALDRDEAVSTGDWTNYVKKYGVSKKVTKYQFDGKYFKSQQTLDKYKEGKFWKEQYIPASKEQRRQLLVDNPEYNRRADWTDEQWDDWKDEEKRKERSKLLGWGDFASKQSAFLETNKTLAGKYLTKRNSGKWLKVKY